MSITGLTESNIAQSQNHTCRQFYIRIIIISMNCRRKLVYHKSTHTGTRRRYELSGPAIDSNPEPPCEAIVLMTLPSCFPNQSQTYVNFKEVNQKLKVYCRWTSIYPAYSKQWHLVCGNNNPYTAGCYNWSKAQHWNQVWNDANLLRPWQAAPRVRLRWHSVVAPLCTFSMSRGSSLKR